MRRRHFIAGLAIATFWPVAARAQQSSGQMRRVGMLLISPEQTPGKLRQAFLDRMRELGWIDGKTIQIHARYAGGALDRLPGLGRCCGRPRTGTRSSGDAERGPLISSRAYHKCIPSTLPQTVASASPLRPAMQRTVGHR